MSSGTFSVCFSYVLKKNIKIFQLGSVFTAIVTFKHSIDIFLLSSLNFTFLSVLFSNKKLKFSL